MGKCSLSILLIDHDQVSRKRLQPWLRPVCFCLDVTDQALTGIDRFDLRRFDLVMIMLTPLGEKGEAVVRRIHRLRPEMPVIGIVENGEAIRSHCDLVLQTPFDKRFFIDAVDYVVGASKATAGAAVREARPWVDCI